MKVKFLGTSAGWPLPRLGHRCELCDSGDLEDKRLRSSVLVNESIIIDAGPDTYQKLIQNNPEKIKYVILTHWHPDHTLGVWDLTHIYNGKESPRVKPLVFGTKPTLKFVSSFIKNLEGQNTTEINFKQTLDLGGVEFFNFEVNHTVGTIAVKISENKKSFVYIPDFKSIPEENMNFARGVDLLVMDGSSLTKDSETKSHQSIETGIKLAKKLKIKQAGFTHL